MHKYEIIIYWDNRDNIYIADVPELPGCSAHVKCGLKVHHLCSQKCTSNLINNS